MKTGVFIARCNPSIEPEKLDCTIKGDIDKDGTQTVVFGESVRLHPGDSVKIVYSTKEVDA